MVPIIVTYTYVYEYIDSFGCVKLYFLYNDMYSLLSGSMRSIYRYNVKFYFIEVFPMVYNSSFDWQYCNNLIIFHEQNDNNYNIVSGLQS